MIGVEPREVPISPGCPDVEDRAMTNESTTPPHDDEHIDHDPNDDHINDDHIADDPNEDDHSPEEEVADDQGEHRSPPPPPPSAPTGPPTPPPAAPPIRRLVRDPYTRLGGVASGIGHYTGLDTSIVRILFIITTFTGGFGLLVYLLAWLVIPRADYWPPAARPVSFREMSGRDLGIGLALIGLLVAVGFGASGATGGFLVPLALVAGGVWLLVQPPSTPVAASADGRGPIPVVEVQHTVGAPVPPPKRRRGRWLIALAVIGALLMAMLIPLFIVLGLAFGSIGDTTQIRPTTVEEIPGFFSDDVDHLEIDLSALDAEDFASGAEPVVIDADVGLGSILVVVPDDIGVSIDSSVGFGSISVFGDKVDGPDSTFDSTASSRNGSVDVELILDVDLGEIEVERP